MISIAVYVSNHGFGHATRMSALVEELVKIGIRCHIVTNRPQEIFSHLNPQYAIYRSKALDFGIRQQDWLNTDVKQTTKDLIELWESKETLIREEVEYCTKEKISFIVSDISFLPFLVAERLSIPGCGISNFDWFYVYDGILNRGILDAKTEVATALSSAIKPVLEGIRDCYKKADFAIALPFSDGESMGSFRKVYSAGLLAKKVKGSRSRLLQDFDLKPDKDVLLLAIKEREWSFEELDNICQTGSYVLCKQDGFSHPLYRRIPESYPFARIVSTVDVIVTKTGYSTLAESVQYGKKVVYTDRKEFPEDRVLVKGMEDYQASYYLHPDELERADWHDILKKLKPKKGKPVPNRNRQVAALLLQKLMGQTQEERYAVIDVGTNNVLMIWAVLPSGKTIHRASRISAIGKNMKNGYLTKAGISRVKKILQDFIEYALAFTDNIVVTGTSCSREAANINVLSDWLRDKYGIVYRILDEEEEPEMAGLANRADFQEYPELVLFDIGGGSTEFVFYRGEETIYRTSLRLGIRRLENGKMTDDEKILVIREQLQKIPSELLSQPVLVGIGGTVTNISAVKKKLYYYDSDTVHKSSLTKEDIEYYFNSFGHLSVSEIEKLMPFEPMRADVIRTGLMIVKEIIEYFSVEEFFVSDRGIQFGILEQIKTQTMKD